jgi:hypothetical protein
MKGQLGVSVQVSPPSYDLVPRVLDAAADSRRLDDPLLLSPTVTQRSVQPISLSSVR